MKTKHDLTLILAVLLFVLYACAGSAETTRQPPGITAPQPTFTATPKATITPDPTPTWTNLAQPTQEAVLPPPAGIVYLTDQGQFITQVDSPPKLLYQPDENGVWSSFSPNQRYSLLFTNFDQVLYEPMSGSRVQIWPRQELNLCPFSWVGGQEALLISVLLPEGEDPEYSCNRGSPVLLDAASQELTILDDTGSGLSGPAVSPDGQMIAYDIAGVPWLYPLYQVTARLDLNQFGVDSLQSAQLADPTWSPSGKYLAWTFKIAGQAGLQGIVILDMDRNAALLFSPFEVSSHENFRPRLYFSPSEKNLILEQYLAAQGDFASQIIALEDGSSRLLDGYFSSWSPANDWLVFERKPGQEACRLTVEAPDGSLSIPICRGDQARWSPDGSQILSYPYDRDQFWLTDLQTQRIVKIDLPAGAQILRWESGQ